MAVARILVVLLLAWFHKYFLLTKEKLYQRAIGAGTSTDTEVTFLCFQLLMLVLQVQCCNDPMSYCPSFKFGLNLLFFFPCCYTYCCIRLKTLFSWQCSYKAWGSLLGQQLSERNVIVACIDYRCFIFLQMLTYRINSLCHMKFDYIIRISICIFIMSVGYPHQHHDIILFLFSMQY